ncbi:MAG: hypothetical protein ACYTBJ_06370 [Planctomycetota bacterium]|jgi:hypothetical protein
MKKIMFVLVALLMAAPAFGDVTITLAAGPGPNDVTVGFNNTEPNRVRAFALDIMLNDPCARISAVDCNNPEYGIYPGSIVIDDSGVVTDDGTCVGDPTQGPAGGTQPGLNTQGVTIEMGSLYEVGVDPPPLQSGNLVIITIEGCDGNTPEDDVTVSLAENSVRGGVVMENPDEVVTVDTSATIVVDIPPCIPPGCPTCAGDLSGDNWKMLADMYMLIGKLNAAGPPYQIQILPSDPPTQWCADLNGDGWIMLSDMYMLIGQLNAAGPPYQIPCP